MRPLLGRSREAEKAFYDAISTCPELCGGKKAARDLHIADGSDLRAEQLK
jgi:hypothetical protein